MITIPALRCATDTIDGLRIPLRKSAVKKRVASQ